MTGKMEAIELPKLSDSQLRDFDTEYVTPEMWSQTEAWIKEAFPDGRFSFLDVGGGNGVFTDTVLDRFPNARGVLIDNGEALLAANKGHPRKTLVCESATNLERRFRGQKFDLISFNWLLHHLILPSYGDSRRLQSDVVTAACGLLSGKGRICVFENLYDGSFIRDLPGWIIYQLTSSKILAPITRRMGANTAGCGVCFGSRSHWNSLFEELKLEIQHFRAYQEYEVSALRRIALHVGSYRVGEYLLAPRRPSVTPTQHA